MISSRPRSARFETVSLLSDAGGTVNEDRAGAAGALAWIIDGASGVSPVRFTAAESDAAWLAAALHAALGAAAEDPAADGRDAVLAELDRMIAEDFAGLSLASRDMADHLVPAAALGLLQAEAVGDRVRIDAAFLADVVMLVPSGGGVLRWSDERLKPFEALTFAALARGDKATREQILQNRQMVNRADGYWVVHPTRPWAAARLAFSAEVAAGDAVVLASDGFMRLVDVFGVESDASLYRALLEGRANERLAMLRALEEESDSLSRHPRPKRRDDATVLVVRAVI